MHDGVVLPDAIADDTWRVNLKGLWNLLDVAQRSETVERVVHVGERPRLLHVLELCSDPSPRCRPPPPPPPPLSITRTPPPPPPEKKN